MKSKTFTPIALLLLCVVVSVPAAGDAHSDQAGAMSAPGQQPPASVAAPSISGSPVAGQVLTASPGDWDGVGISYSYEWQRCDTAGDACASITAADSAYVLASDDVGGTLRVIVTASNKNGTAQARSDSTPIIAPASVVSVPTTTTTTTTTPTTTTPSTTPGDGTAYFLDQFETTLPGAWSQSPADAVSSGLISSVAGQSGNGVELKATPTSTGPSGSEMTSLWFDNSDSRIHTSAGDDTWYRMDIQFRSGVFYPTTGHWNWIAEWHDGVACSSAGAVSIALGVYTDYPTVSGAVGANPRLAFRPAGGSCTSPTYQTFELPSNSLRWDHWYTLLFHIVWSNDSNVGLVEWYVDATKITGEYFPTLYKNSDGTLDKPSFGIYNYRFDDPVHISGVDFDNVAIGPTQASVGG
jgi:hypothetical protein